LFEENIPWEWNKATENSHNDLDTFIVQYEDTDQNPTIGTV